MKIEPLEAQLDEVAESTYKTVNAITRFYASQIIGNRYECNHIEHALVYWQWRFELALDAFKEKFGFDYKDRHAEFEKLYQKDPCIGSDFNSYARRKGIHFWRMARATTSCERKMRDLDYAAEAGINWHGLKPVSLFDLGNQAYVLMP